MQENNKDLRKGLVPSRFYIGGGAAGVKFDIFYVLPSHVIDKLTDEARTWGRNPTDTISYSRVHKI